MESILLKNVKIVDPENKQNGKRVDISIEKGIIKAIEKAGSLSAKKNMRVWEEKGACVSPGWVDTCVHLSDPGFEFKEPIAALANAAQKGGFTDILCYPNTYPVVDNSQMLHSLTQRTRGFNVNFHFSGAISQGTEGHELAEMYDMHLAGAKVFTDGSHPLQSAGLLMRALQYLQTFEGTVVTYPDDGSLSSGSHMNEGETSTLLGMKGNPELAEAARTVRDLEILKYTGGKLHLQPMSSPDAIQHIHAAKRQHKNRLSVGVSIHNLAWDDSEVMSFDSNFKLSPPLRSKAQVRKLKQAFKAGKIEVLCSGHFAQGLEQKDVEFYQAEAGIIGLQTFFSLAVTHLLNPKWAGLDDLIRAMSTHPRKLLNLPSAAIEVGNEASLSLFDPKGSWDFSEKSLYSRARNTSLLNQTLDGKVFGICHQGELHISN